jgi:hypothetical protein
MTTVNSKTGHNATRRTDTGDPDTPLGRAPKTSQGRSGGVAYATSAQLTSLAEYLTALTITATDTGWHSPNMIVSMGEVEEESIVVGVRWINGAYVVEIR